MTSKKSKWSFVHRKSTKTVSMDKNIEIVQREYLKILEIIKAKKVNVYDFNRVNNVNDYNNYLTLEFSQELTEEEFNLLKEWLEK